MDGNLILSLLLIVSVIWLVVLHYQKALWHDRAENLSEDRAQYGFNLAYYQDKWPDVRDQESDTSFALMMSVVTIAFPFCLLILWIRGGCKYGLKFKAEPPTGRAID